MNYVFWLTIYKNCTLYFNILAFMCTNKHYFAKNKVNAEILGSNLWKSRNKILSHFLKIVVCVGLRFSAAPRRPTSLCAVYGSSLSTERLDYWIECDKCSSCASVSLTVCVCGLRCSAARCAFHRQTKRVWLLEERSGQWVSVAAWQGINLAAWQTECHWRTGTLYV